MTYVKIEVEKHKNNERVCIYTCTEIRFVATWTLINIHNNYYHTILTSLLFSVFLIDLSQNFFAVHV